jgi:sugar transferase (PEP-CTERM/EpsH1 system associated)
MPIRIMHVVEAVGVGGGVENGIANVIENSDSSRFDHVLCGVFGVGTQIERYPSDRVQLVCLDQERKRFAIQVGSLGRMIRKLQPDVVHSRNWGALEAVLAARWTRLCPVIHSEHGFEVVPAAEPRRRSWFRRIAFEMADRVFSVSSQLRETLAKRTGFPARKIGVIHNGVQTQRFRPDGEARRQVRGELGIGAEEFCIGAVGRLNRIKDYPTLLRAADIFGASCASWRLLIAGDGAEHAALQELVASSPRLSGRVQFLGALGRIPDFLNALDVYALPSLCEGISNSLLEAMASGLPVVATDVGGNPEVVENGESGLLFPVGDIQALAGRLLRLQSKMELRQRIGQRAVQRVQEQFSLDAMVGKYEEMYTHLGAKRAADRMRVQSELCRPGNY